MKTFTVEDYVQTTKEQKAEIDAWLTKYNLLNACQFIQQFEDTIGDPIEEAIKLVAWGYKSLPRHTKDGTIRITDDCALDLEIIAEFEFDDFPWESIDH